MLFTNDSDNRETVESELTDGPQTSHLIKFYWSHWSSTGCSETVEDVWKIISATPYKAFYYTIQTLISDLKVLSIFLHGYLSPEQSCPHKLCLAKFVWTENE